ncbi:hypothetical protein V565_149590 [Rhizoctonia solani 123E]|uniref:Uncharacterized protein n=1 Tax=Rhizoctonia solani 123E TaxID=1423351 RepID=A0A074RKI9_9AGAM|nr:hypothetical protein V565_149590 [Rhizoctonia solani 123E]
MTPKEKYAGKNIQARRGKDKPKDLWTRRDNIELEHDSDDEVSNPSDLIPSPYTPTCKGYSLESDLVKEVSACYYFVVPVQLEQSLTETAVFSLSPERRMVSLVNHIDANSSFYPYHVDLSFDTIIHFTIEGLRYQWDTQRGTLTILLSEKLRADSSVRAPEPLSVCLHANLEGAMMCEGMLRFDDLTLQDDLGPDPSPSPPTNSDPSTALNVPGMPLTCHSPYPLGSLFEVGFFEPSPSQENIDRWVDEIVARHQTTRDGTYLKCPEAGCIDTARRPHALKTHLYTHYGIKLLTEANRLRHIRSAHTCPGCGFVGSNSTIKSHMAVCSSATISSGPTRGNLNIPRSPFIAPHLRF